ncbi:hypothetical protein ACFLV7_00520 [Chloroflexota bacterium]
MARDLRRYAKQTNIRLIIGGIAILVIIGDGLILLFYGRDAAVLGLLCLVIGLMPLLLIWVVLSIFGWVVRRSNAD